MGGSRLHDSRPFLFTTNAALVLSRLDRPTAARTAPNPSCIDEPRPVGAGRASHRKKQVMEIDGSHFEALNLKATNLLLKGQLQESVAEIYKVRSDGGGNVMYTRPWFRSCPTKSHHVGLIPSLSSLQSIKSGHLLRASGARFTHY